ncbi:hypothetical protein ACVGV9_00065, partial [Enterobacter hormaechei]
LEAVIEEYGAPASRSAWLASYNADVIAHPIHAQDPIEFVKNTPPPTLQKTTHRVAGLIKPCKTHAGVLLSIIKKTHPPKKATVYRIPY